MNNVFVFVVCGAKEHIDTLHFSLKALRKYSQKQIVIITDKTRNEISIQHEQIIDIQTPKELNHHQASIFLKTGIHKFLPNGNTYCYLDTDVLALNSGVDIIFNEFKAPIVFAADHCNLPKFSLIAINCNCKDLIIKNTKKFDYFLKENIHKINFNRKQTDEMKLLNKFFEKINNNSFLMNYYKFKFKIFNSKVWINNQFYFDKKEHCWRNTKGAIVMYDIGVNEFAQKLSFHYSEKQEKWVNEFENDFWTLECNHLKDAIAKQLKINIANKSWQHWNGGVFLFNDESHAFLEAWHKKTLQIFNMPNWKTRDQGTLIATAWEFGLENHSVLNKKWNFLADYNNKELDFDNEGFFTDDNWQTKYKLNFAHVYHHWGDKNWALWNWIEKKVNE